MLGMLGMLGKGEGSRAPARSGPPQCVTHHSVQHRPSPTGGQEMRVDWGDGAPGAEAVSGHYGS